MSPRACPICGSQRTQSCGERAFNCNGCGLIFIMPLETERPEAIYDERYFKGGVYRDYFSEESTMVDYFERKIRLIEKHLPVSGRVLDIGCAAGFFLKAMKKRGYEVSGMDISECATRYARESLGVGITTGDITSASLPADSFDIITMWDVLEHLRDPMVAIRQAHRSLKDTGTLVVETLNIDSLNFKLLGRRWPLWYPPYHITYFTEKALSIGLKRGGFQVSETYPIQIYAWQGRIFRHLGVPILKEILGSALDDVILVVAKKSSKNPPEDCVRCLAF